MIGTYSVYAEYSVNNQLFNTELISYDVVNPINKVLIKILQEHKGHAPVKLL